ncbi:TlpA family protein disulfide reductase [Alistipes sp.]|uniref:TlpA family protein disulfide reductase n=1 Tax=Alistipes sp. TaxID=1872444 RepID=UPI003AEFF719
MRNLPIPCCAAAVALLSFCTPANRIVENPLIETANTQTLDIVQVCLSDTATVLHMNACFTPRKWIRIDAKSYLRTGGRKYMLTGADGIAPDSLFWMPDSGEASFALRFQPLPLGTKSFDFIESDCDDCFKLYGVDLTGKTAYAEYPEGLPRELRKAPEDGPVPDPILAVGETTVNLHLLGYREGMLRGITIYVNSLLTGQKSYDARVDPASGVATVTFAQYGTGVAFLANTGVHFSPFWIAPGEAVDLYLDLRSAGKAIVQRRNRVQRHPGPRLYARGTYADLNMLVDRNECGRIALEMYTGDFADYRMTADEFTQMLVSEYRTLADSIARSGMSEMVRELSLLSLRQQMLQAIASGRFLLEHNYRAVNERWDLRDKIDYRFAEIGPEHVAAVCQLFDAADPKLPMGFFIGDYRDAAMNPKIDWAKAANTTAGTLVALHRIGTLPSKAENDQLTEEELNMLRTLEDPFYAEACEAIRAKTRRELAAVDGRARIEPTPDVSLDELFDAIVEPFKGKVVLVDFWNTWCVPCQAAIQAVEPLKNAELGSDDLVWIYIANETSPLVTYKTRIATIRGRHFRLNDKQWGYLCEQFRIDGIPSYVVVGKEGSYKLRNDLRDHEKLKRELQKMID